MNDNDFRKLKGLVVAFHDALERHDFSDSRLNLRKFPVECCHYACNLLTIFLFDQGYTNIQKFSGGRPDDSSESHLWLTVNGVIVDITAYQFDETIEKAIVARDSSWHSVLHGEPSDSGLPGEPLNKYVERAKSHFSGLDAVLSKTALCILAERPQP